MGVARQHFVTLGELVDDLRVIKEGVVGGRPRRGQRPDAGAPGHKGDTEDQETPPQAAAPQAKTN